VTNDPPPSNATPKRPNLLTLPPELRLQIYEHLFTSSLLPYLSTPSRTTPLNLSQEKRALQIPSILQTNRLLRTEAVPACTSLLKHRIEHLRETQTTMTAQSIAAGEGKPHLNRY